MTLLHGETAEYKIASAQMIHEFSGGGSTLVFLFSLPGFGLLTLDRLLGAVSADMDGV